jgi:hypothetical protein
VKFVDDFEGTELSANIFPQELSPRVKLPWGTFSQFANPSSVIKSIVAIVHDLKDMNYWSETYFSVSSPSTR